MNDRMVNNHCSQEFVDLPIKYEESWVHIDQQKFMKQSLQRCENASEYLKRVQHEAFSDSTPSDDGHLT